MTWSDGQGNSHDLDYILERDGASDKQGEPVAFIELAWRRYTKHSRNKTGEIEGALLPLRHTYRNTCSFVGAILAGEYTEGGINQLRSHDIEVLSIPYHQLVDSFMAKGIELDYPESAPNEQKANLIRQWNLLTGDDLEDIKESFQRTIHPQYSIFKATLECAILRKVKSVRVLALHGREVIFDSIDDAMESVRNYDYRADTSVSFIKFEVYIRFSNGDRVEGAFQSREETLGFLGLFL